MDCVVEAADDGVEAATRIFRLLSDDRRRILEHDTAVSMLRLFELLPEHPMVTLPLATELLGINKVTAQRTIEALEQVKVKVLREVTGKARDRVYAYRKYIAVLSEDTDVIEA